MAGGEQQVTEQPTPDSANSTRLSKVPCGNLRHKIFRTHAANLRADYTSHGPCMHAQRSSINEDVWFLIFAANCPFWRLRQGREAAGNTHTRTAEPNAAFFDVAGHEYPFVGLKGRPGHRRAVVCHRVPRTTAGSAARAARIPQ